MVSVETVMAVNSNQGLWRESPMAAKWALSAAVFLAVVAIVPFVVTTVLVSLERQLPPLTVIFGPMPGNPLIMWLYFTLPPAIIQAAAGLALRHRRTATQLGGIVGVLVLATIALGWLGAIAILAIGWLMTGALAGDFRDLLGMVLLGLPVLLVAAGLNLRAALLAMRDLHRRARHRLTSQPG